VLPARWSRNRRPLALGVLAAVVVPLSVSAPAAQADDETARVVGELVQAWAEHLDPAEAAEHAEDGPLSWIETGAGDSVRVATVDVENIPVGSIVAATVGDEVADAASEEQGLDPAREVLAATVLEAAPADPPPVAAAGTATNRVTVVRVVPAENPAADTTTSADVAALVNGAVKTFWAEQTDQVVQIEGTAWPTDVQLDSGCNDWFGMWREAADAVAFDPSDGNHLLLYLANAPANFRECADGLGTVGDSRSSGGLLYTKSLAPAIIAHEMGHNFGLGHSSSRQCTGPRYTGTCSTSEYADYYDVMGFSWGPIGSLNVVQASRVGVAVSTRSYALGSPAETATLAPVSQRGPSPRAISMDVGGATYWLEYRPSSGRDAWLGTADNRLGLESGVLLRMTSSGNDTSLLLDGSPSPQADWGDDLNLALPVGSPVQLAGGPQNPGTITVTVTSVSAAGAEITLSSARQLPGSSLVRTPDNATVYLLSGVHKYAVGDLATLAALAPLGPVKFLSRQQLDRWMPGPRMGRVVAGPDGTTYFIDAGTRLPFSSCAQVTEFGSSCAAAVPLEQSQINAFAAGPLVAPLLRTTSGKSFYVTGGAKREVVDDAALTAAGLPTTGVRLSETGLGYLPYGPPVTRDGVALLNRSTGAATVATGGAFITVPELLRAATALRSLPVRALDDASIRRLTTTVVPGPVVKEAGGSRVFLLTEAGRRQLTDPAMLPASVPEVSPAFLALLPDSGTTDGAGFVKGSASGTVYVLRAGQRRVVSSWSDLVALNGGHTPSILTIDERLASLLPLGPAQLGPGSLVHSPRSATVFFVNGRAELIPVGSFNTTGELGAARLVRVANTVADAYTVRSTGIGTAVDCAGTRYLGLGGRLYTVGPDVAAHFPLSYTSVDPAACAALPKARGLTRFLRAASGTIYLIENGSKRPIRSFPGYLALGGISSNTIQVSDFALRLIPTGATW